MPEDNLKELSLQDQILQEMFVQLGKQEVFDPETLTKLEILIGRGELKKTAKVLEVIKPVEGK